MPVSSQPMDEAQAQAFAVYQSTGELVLEKYGMRLLRADEDGLAPPFPDLAVMFDDAITVIGRAGLQPADDDSLAADVAASHFFHWAPR